MRALISETKPRNARLQCTPAASVSRFPVRQMLSAVAISAMLGTSAVAGAAPLTCVESIAFADAGKEWQELTHSVLQHDLVEIEVATSGRTGGTWHYCGPPEDQKACPSTADGLPENPASIRNPIDLVFPDATVGTLIGRVGTLGTMFRIGSSYAFSSPTDGPLLVMMNDLPLSTDNWGRLIVRYKICR